MKAGAVLIVVSMALGVAQLALALARPQYLHDDHAGHVTIPPGTFYAFEFVVYGELTEIGYSFQVNGDPAVDIYIVSDDGYARYVEGLPLDPNLGDHTIENVRSVDDSPYYGEGSYHAIIDNSDYGEARPDGQTAQVSYRVTAGGLPEGNADVPFGEVAVLGLAALGFVCGLVLVSIGTALPAERMRVPQREGVGR